jgi:hypothetical protein
MNGRAKCLLGLACCGIVAGTSLLSFSQDRKDRQGRLGNPLLRIERNSVADQLGADAPEVRELDRRILIDEKLTKNPEQPVATEAEPDIRVLFQVVLGLQNRVAQLEKEVAILKRENLKLKPENKDAANDPQR